MHIVYSCPRILEVTTEYLGDIRVLVDLCLKVLLELLNRLIRRNNFEVVSYPTIISTFVLCY